MDKENTQRNGHTYKYQRSSSPPGRLAKSKRNSSQRCDWRRFSQNGHIAHLDDGTHVWWHPMSSGNGCRQDKHKCRIYSKAHMEQHDLQPTVWRNNIMQHKVIRGLKHKTRTKLQYGNDTMILDHPRHRDKALQYSSYFLQRLRHIDDAGEHLLFTAVATRQHEHVQCILSWGKRGKRAQAVLEGLFQHIVQPQPFIFFKLDGTYPCPNQGHSIFSKALENAKNHVRDKFVQSLLHFMIQHNLQVPNADHLVFVHMDASTKQQLDQEVVEIGNKTCSRHQQVLEQETSLPSVLVKLIIYYLIPHCFQDLLYTKVRQ